MMKMTDIMKMMFIATFLAICFIHLQMNIYQMAYQGSERHKKIENLTEKNLHLKNDIVRLQSSDHIGRELLVKSDQKYHFAGEDSVIEVAALSDSFDASMGSSKQENGFLAHVWTMAFAGSHSR